MANLEVRVGCSGIVIVEHDRLRVLVATILKAELGFTKVITTNSLSEAMGRLADTRGVSLAFLDVGGSGLTEATNLAILRECFPDIRLVVCGPLRRADILLALHSGIHGYVSEEMGMHYLTQALSKILAGEVFVPPIVADLTLKAPTPATASTRNRTRERQGGLPAQSPAPDIRLTSRQTDVLRLIIDGRSNKEIAGSLNLCESTVKVHVAAIFRALGVHSRIGAAGIGIQFISSSTNSSPGYPMLR